MRELNLKLDFLMQLVQEKLEHCLGSRPSIGQDIDGESISHLRRLAEKHPIFNSPSVGVAYNIASFSYDTERGRQTGLEYAASCFTRLRPSSPIPSSRNCGQFGCAQEK